jgi:hypothetical protein
VRAGRVVTLVLAVLAVLVAGTWLAGEWTEVVLLRTFDADGRPHSTKLWLVEMDGARWIRVARPNRRWYRRILAHPNVELVRNGVTQPCRAVPIRDSDTRKRVNDAFRAKYGWVDWWYGVLLRRDAIPVRLDPVAGPREATGP